MLRISVCLVAAALAAVTLSPVVAQTAAPAAAPAAIPAPAPAKPSKMKLTAAKLKDMKAKWSANKGKLKACRAEVRSKGLAGDDRWFYIEDCMAKSLRSWTARSLMDGWFEAGHGGHSRALNA